MIGTLFLLAVGLCSCSSDDVEEKKEYKYFVGTKLNVKNKEESKILKQSENNVNNQIKEKHGESSEEIDEDDEDEDEDSSEKKKRKEKEKLNQRNTENLVKFENCKEDEIDNEQSDNEVYCIYVSYEDEFISKLK